MTYRPTHERMKRREHNKQVEATRRAELIEETDKKLAKLIIDGDIRCECPECEDRIAYQIALHMRAERKQAAATKAELEALKDSVVTRKLP